MTSVLASGPSHFFSFKTSIDSSCRRRLVMSSITCGLSRSPWPTSRTLRLTQWPVCSEDFATLSRELVNRAAAFLLLSLLWFSKNVETFFTGWNRPFSSSLSLFSKRDAEERFFLELAALGCCFLGGGSSSDTEGGSEGALASVVFFCFFAFVGAAARLLPICLMQNSQSADAWKEQAFPRDVTAEHRISPLAPVYRFP